MKAKKVLYFVAGDPTPAQLTLARKNGAEIVDVLHYHDADPLIVADQVLGIAPERYLEAYEKHSDFPQSEALAADPVAKKPAKKAATKEG
jgi:hypothetical protein